MHWKQKSTGLLPFWLCFSISHRVFWLQEHLSMFLLLATFLRLVLKAKIDKNLPEHRSSVLFTGYWGGTVSRGTNEEKCESGLFSESLSEGQSRTWCSLNPYIPVTWFQAMSPSSEHPALLNTLTGDTERMQLVCVWYIHVITSSRCVTGAMNM